MKKVIYTVNIGGYDTLQPPQYIDAGIEYLCITDSPDPLPRPWKKLSDKEFPLKFKNDHELLRHYNQRTLKILNLSEDMADITLYHDANLVQKASVLPLFDRLIESKADFMAMTHPERDCVYEEIQACYELRKATSVVLRKQKEFYLSEGLPPHNGLIASGVLVRYTDEKYWGIDLKWKQVLDVFSHRDQIAFAYAEWKNPINKTLVPWAEMFATYFTRVPHAIKRTY